MIIPRGGKGLIERISREAKVPVIKHLDGNCHVYVDDTAELDMAVTIVDNAKTQKYSPCNAAEGLLVAASIAEAFLPEIGAIFAAKGVEMRCDPAAARILRAEGALRRRRSSTRWSPTGPRNTWPPSSASRWWRAWTRPSRTSTAIRATTPMPSSRATTCTRSASCARSTRPA